MMHEWRRRCSTLLSRSKTFAYMAHNTLYLISCGCKCIESRFIGDPAEHRKVNARLYSWLMAYQTILNICLTSRTEYIICNSLFHMHISRLFHFRFHTLYVIPAKCQTECWYNENSKNEKMSNVRFVSDRSRRCRRHNLLVAFNVRCKILCSSWTIVWMHFEKSCWFHAKYIKIIISHSLRYKAEQYSLNAHLEAYL